MEVKDFRIYSSALSATEINEMFILATVSKTLLNEKIAEAELLGESEYTAESWAGLAAVLASAKSVSVAAAGTQV